MIDLTKYQTYSHSFEIHPIDVFSIDIHPETVGNIVASESLNPPIPTPTADYLYFEAKQANSTVAMTSMLTTAPNMEYSTDGSTFQEWQHTTSEGTHVFDTITLGAVGDKVYIRGVNATFADNMESETPEMSYFSMSGDIKAGGSVQSLVDGTGESTTAILMPFLFSMFIGGANNTALTEVANTLLPATTLTMGCYNGMFAMCTALSNAPELPATALANGCYATMFRGCSSLTESPVLAAETLTIACYAMMFAMCSSLIKITCLATDISAAQSTQNWTQGVAASGTFYKAATMSGWTEGTDGIPSGWTVVDYSA